MGTHLMGCECGTSSTKQKETKKEEPSRINEYDKAQLDIKSQITKIKDQRLFVETRSKQLKEEALEQKAKGNKTKAICALKMKKLIESRNEKLDGMLLTLEQTLNNLQEAVMNKQVHDVLKQGNEAIKELQKGVTAEDFQKIADDLQDQQEINDELARALGVEAVDEGEFEEELKKLEAEDVKKQLKNAPQDQLPKVTPKKPARAKKEEEKQAVSA
eukprot:TRINITY_DN4472_c0_g1_i1.p1 TRINITY_DN4472_c0_g1~~TRINITY_DN4472_c0_g1_i1.p1  ORF type:complete len:216 (-),score=106.38 TRINITY_DN4472_c0_g1_i1:112-759(-)